MGNEFSNDLEKFMTKTISTQKSSLGQLVSSYFKSPMISRKRSEMPIFPGKDWGTYEVRDSNTGIFDGGWAHILVIENYEWEKHSHFRSIFSNTLPALSDKFSSKPLVIFVSVKNEGFQLIDRGSFFEIAVNQEIDESSWAQSFSKLIISNPTWLEGAREGIAHTFERYLEKS